MLGWFYLDRIPYSFLSSKLYVDLALQMVLLNLDNCTRAPPHRSVVVAVVLNNLIHHIWQDHLPLLDGSPWIQMVVLLQLDSLRQEFD